VEKNPIFQCQLVENSRIPLYYQLVANIKRCITGGLLKPGDIIPSESEICEVFQISRSTVRQALGELEAEGLLLRKRGKGTFVSNPKLRRKLDSLYSFSNDMIQQGLIPESKMIDFEKRKPSLDIIKNLNLTDESELVFKIVRIRLANSEPILLETTFVPVKYCAFLEKEMLEKDSLYRILREVAFLEPYYAVETYEPVLFKKEEAQLLQCKPGLCGYFVERTSYIETGEIFELTQSIVRGDKCRFEVELYKDSVNFSRKIDN
jgi:GntR family transcriptional regulator